jgi:putative PIN family toxin of toxin-antitoxin system
MNRIRDGQDSLCLSASILEEYLAVLRYAGISTPLIETFLSLLKDPGRAVVAVPARRIQAVREDPSDNMFLECAVEARADYVVSGDRHLRRLQTFAGIPILSPREYITKTA